jgi:hypothetical protein
MVCKVASHGLHPLVLEGDPSEGGIQLMQGCR